LCFCYRCREEARFSRSRGRRVPTENWKTSWARWWIMVDSL